MKSFALALFFSSASATISDQQHSLVSTLHESPLAASQALWQVSMTPQADEELRKKWENSVQKAEDFYSYPEVAE